MAGNRPATEVLRLLMRAPGAKHKRKENNMEKVKLVFFVACCALVLNGCAFGNTHRYHDTIASINASGTIAIGVATHDQREYVVSGRKNPDFIGLQRGGYGNPFDVSTARGNPLAEDMTQSIVNSLVKKGFKAIPVLVTHADERQSVIDKLKVAGGERLLIFTLTEWKSDTFQNTALIYDIKAEVLEQAGKTMAEKEIKGKDDLGGSFWNAPAHAKKAIPIAFREKIEKLLNSSEIEAALR